MPEVRVNFPVEAGSWVRTPAWPVFLQNVALSAWPGAGERVVPPCTVGEPCAVPPGGRLTDPGGRVLGSTGSFIPWHAGVYRVGGTPLAVNRLAGPEADLTAPGSPGRTGGGVSLPPPGRVWVLLLALALALLLVEGVLALRAEPALRRCAGWTRGGPGPVGLSPARLGPVRSAATPTPASSPARPCWHRPPAGTPSRPPGGSAWGG